MSEELVQLVEKGYDAWNSGDRNWVLDHMAEDVEWITPEDDPDPGTYRGHEGIERYWSQWRAAVGQLNFQIDRVIQVYEFEGGKCRRVREYYDRAAALSSVRGDRSGASS